MQNRRRALWWRARWRVVIAPVAVLLALCLPKLGQGGWSTDTPWYAAIALQAWSHAGAGDVAALWDLPGIGAEVPPSGDGAASTTGQQSVPYFNKPPLGFVLGGLPLWLTGPTLLGARLGSVLAAAMCVVITVVVVRAGAGRTVALSAGLVLAMTLEFSRHARSFSLDLWMTLFLMAALWPAVVAVARGEARAARLIALSGVGIGLALMVKPLVGLLVLPILALWLVWVGRARWIGWVLAAGLMACVIAGPWHFLMWWTHGRAFTDQYFGREIADRAAGGGGGGTGVGGGGTASLNQGAGDWWYYFPTLGENYLPWAVAVLAAFGAWGVAHLVSKRKQVVGPSQSSHATSGLERATPWLKLGLVWTIVWLIALSSFADKRPRYLLVLYPVWAWVSAEFLVTMAPMLLRRLWRGLTRWIVPIALVGAIALAVLPVSIHKADSPQWAALFTWIREQKAAEIYQGGFVGQRAARLYLEFGRWPVPTRSNAGEVINSPPKKAYIVYHRRDGLSPGPNETIRFESGELVVTRLESEPWMPVSVPDPGE